MLSHFFKSKKVIATFWVFGGYASVQLIRLCSNLILTRLLAPEMFGVMTLVNSIIIGVHLLSDVGVRDSVINNKKSTDVNFLKTAWTINVLKGFFVFIVLCLIAVPMENYFQYENLSTLIIACAFSCIINGLSSINIFLLQKSLDFQRQTYLEIMAIFISSIVTISVAYFYNTVWSLVCGVIIQSIISALFSHIILPGPKIIFFGLHHTSVKIIIRYGKWIFLSTATTYIVLHIDKVILASQISAVELGLYGIAIIFGYLSKEIISHMSARLLLPVYCEIIENNDDLLRGFKLRWSLLGVATLGAFILSFSSEYLIQWLYDDRYSGVTWILQFLTLAGLCHSFDDTIRIFLVARKDSLNAFRVQLAKSIVFVLLATSLSGEFGMMGVLLAMALTPVLIYPYLLCLAGRYGYRWWYFDAVMLTAIVFLFPFMWCLQNDRLWQQLVLLVNL